MFGDPGPDVEIRRASTVIALREGGAGLEVLMVRRASDAVFMGGARVFPGGAIDPGDEQAAGAVAWSGPADELPWRAAALRELAEEAGVFLTDPPGAVAGPGEDGVYATVADAAAVLAADRLAYLANWVTPPGPPRRFDTRFFVAEVPDGTRAAADRTEVFDPAWVTPAEALSRADAGIWSVEFPTRRHLELLTGFDKPAAVLDHARSLAAIPRIEPRVVFDGDGSWRVTIPGDPGHEEA